MASKYLFNRETTNFARLSRLIIDVCRDLLISVLKAKLPPPGLTAILQSQKVQLLQNLEPRQRQILYPTGGVFSGTLEDLDFPILYKLLRNFLGINIPPHRSGWGRTPDPADRSLSANIDRLRVHRNEAYGNLPTVSLSDSEFNSRWSLIRQSVFEIEKDALIGDTYVKAVDALLTNDIDPDAEKRYIQEVLMKTKKAESEVKGADAATVNQDISEALQEKIAMCHSEMVIELADSIYPAAWCWPAFKQLLSIYLDRTDLAEENFYYYVDKLLDCEWIDLGRYRRLYDVVYIINKKASCIIKKAESDIEAMKNGGRPKEIAFQVEGNWKCDFEKINPERWTSHVKEQFPDMKARITGIGGSGADAATVNQDVSKALQEKIAMCHSVMVIKLAGFIYPAADCWPAFKQLLSVYLNRRDIEEENLYYYVDTLLHLECIDLGRYRRLYDVVHKINKVASSIIIRAESDIEAMKNGAGIRSDESETSVKTVYSSPNYIPTDLKRM
ncbi:uncharacterized protein LOC110455196, partial [Mizuhopecten yessoensis]|uniref:uncharacterized protein LOC110455196 n=1 Tax=Mizuhopecten yessoensis TaxID=6573 RepID=UPI000B458588